MTRALRAIVASIALPIGAGLAQATPSAGETDACTPTWIPTFGGAPGTSGSGWVYCSAVFDDGTGPALYVGGLFTTMGGAHARCVAKWDGATWTQVGDGLDMDMGTLNPFVYALEVFDDGTGPALYAGGVFNESGSARLNNLARLEGGAWTSVGGGVTGIIRALHSHDDGNGPALYVGGDIDQAGEVPVENIARWDGAAWSTLDSGMNGEVHALATFDDGAGAALCAGGDFTMAGSAHARRIARWNGVQWSALGAGANDTVRALATNEASPEGPSTLYAGGDFTMVGEAHAHRIAAWDGAAWSTLGRGADDTVHAILTIDEGHGPTVYATGQFTSIGEISASWIARWDGEAWSPLHTGLQWPDAPASPSGGFSLTRFDDPLGTTPRFFVTGRFLTAGPYGANDVAAWHGESWHALGSGLGGVDSGDGIYAMTIWDDGLGGGPALFAGGEFVSSSGVILNKVAKWTGSGWESLAGGVDGAVLALVVHDDGSGAGPALYVGGSFTKAGDVQVNHIARWDGRRWSPLGSGLGGAFNGVGALASIEIDGAPHLVAGGYFEPIDGAPATHLAKWNGTTWSPIGGAPNDGVSTLCVRNEGGAPALYAGGSFTLLGTTPANRIARWDGRSWSALGAGLDNWVRDLAIHDDGNGEALYAVGMFKKSGTTTVNRVARWSGAAWMPLGSGLDIQSGAAAVSFDDGSGPALYVGGVFNTAGGVAAPQLARWNGRAWSAVPGWVPPKPGTTNHRELTVFDVGVGHPFLLYATSGVTGPGGDSYLFRYGCPE